MKERLVNANERMNKRNPKR